mgnify:FL=1
MQIKIDAPVGPMAPPNTDALEAGNQEAGGAWRPVATETENSSRGSEGSFEPKVGLGIESFGFGSMQGIN